MNASIINKIHDEFINGISISETVSELYNEGIERPFVRITMEEWLNEKYGPLLTAQHEYELMENC
jgi:hypothetical protein